jgi:sulfite reductase alpha subunit-like flavoprotein
MCSLISLFVCCTSGDHVAVYPTNEERLVNRIGELLGVDLDTIFTLTNTDGKFL